MHRSKWNRNSSTSCWRSNGASRPKAFAAFILITEVREFNGEVFKIGQN